MADEEKPPPPAEEPAATDAAPAATPEETPAAAAAPEAAPTPAPPEPAPASAATDNFVAAAPAADAGGGGDMAGLPLEEEAKVADEEEHIPLMQRVPNLCPPLTELCVEVVAANFKGTRYISRFGFCTGPFSFRSFPFLVSFVRGDDKG